MHPSFPSQLPPSALLLSILDLLYQLRLYWHPHQLVLAVLLCTHRWICKYRPSLAISHGTFITHTYEPWTGVANNTFLTTNFWRPVINQASMWPLYATIDKLLVIQPIVSTVIIDDLSTLHRFPSVIGFLSPFSTYTYQHIFVHTDRCMNISHHTNYWSTSKRCYR